MMADQVIPTTPTVAPTTPASETPAPTSIVAAATAPAPVVEPTAGAVLFPELSKTEEVRLAEPKVEEVKPAVEGEVKPEVKVEEPVVVEALPEKAEDYKVTLPSTVTVDPALMSEFQTLALTVKLPPSVAQKMADVFTSAVTKQNEANLAAFTEVQSRWVSEVNRMPEFTGEAAKAQSLAAIGRVLDEFGSQEVRSIMEQTGAGNNPAVVKMFLQLSSALNEGRTTPQGRPPNSRQPRTPGQIMFPNSVN